MPLAMTGLGIKPNDLEGVEEHLARRILIRARAIEPRIRTVVEGSEEKADAVAILLGVAARAGFIGTGAVASQSRNGTSISFRQIQSAFDLDDIANLRAIFLDPDQVTPSPLPRASFPTERPIARLWPETYS